MKMTGACIGLLTLISIDVARAEERDVAAEFKAVKASLAQQLHDRKAENRLAAVQKLEAFPTVESAKLLLFQGLTSKDEEVRKAAFDALARLSGEKPVADFLKTTVLKQWRGKPQEETYAGLAILLACELPDVRAQATELVQDASQRQEPGRIALITLADEMANCRGEGVSRALTQLVELPLFEQDFAFRRAVVQALTQVRAKGAITNLISLLSFVKGEARSDIVRYLTDLSGQQLGIEPAGWQAWWLKEETKFEFPPEIKRTARAQGNVPPPKPPAGPSYYGLPLSGARIVFIIDTSGSMNGPRIVAAKRELSRAINELPADVEFNILAFNTRVYPWQTKLVPAAADFKQNALYFIALQGLSNATVSYDALEAALQFDAEVIYFLTDGAPSGGKVTNPTDIVRQITRLNQYRRMTINSLGIGVGRPGNNFDTFLSTLARENYGEYQRVDE